MKRHTLAACLLLASPIALAKQGFYLGTDQSVSFYSYQSDDLEQDYRYDVSPKKVGVGIGATLGYQFIDWLALEVGVSYWLANPISQTVSYSYGEGHLERAIISLETQSLNLNIGPKFSWRVANKLSLYGKPTLHYTTTSTDWDKYTASYIDNSLILTSNERKKTRNSTVHSGIEVGSEWHFTPRFSMTLSYQYLTDALNVDSPEIAKEFDQQAIKIGVLFDI
ncbi:porin family protein [Vibrio vulnificus]|uniref:porin family protein n=1 Tax=Vibrio vulnificus TaxID=672 RepID=UPI000CD077BD|nr:porin family protein [Vibrio vulnificus]EHD1695218.1 porin family protein [Vibrio vulnificus]EHU4975931.1 porin family protein [Vibrio vulnificus]ELU4007355.1 porin family protein [Vibrio vulnificus]MCU8446025.1 porin family protein [Vibrio vulnificus]POC39601.1 hypothetical protein CRN38_03615 [Vibrio vulnificus]